MYDCYVAVWFALVLFLRMANLDKEISFPVHLLSNAMTLFLPSPQAGQINTIGFNPIHFPLFSFYVVIVALSLFLPPPTHATHFSSKLGI